MSTRRTRTTDAANDGNAANGASVVARNTAAASYWQERIAWYPDGCFGPYRPSKVGYSRRELAADGAVHVLGVFLGFLGVVALCLRLSVSQVSERVVLSLVVYGASLLAMLLCSAIFNMSLGAWSRRIVLLQLADHGGILLLIAGTYTPFMTIACSPQTLAFVWALALVSFFIKASRSRLDVELVHIPIFLLMGWAVVSVWDEFSGALSPWGKRTCLLGGVLYTIGLVPWGVNKIEGHNALWHLFVLAGSGCFFVVCYDEVGLPPVLGTRNLTCL